MNTKRSLLTNCVALCLCFVMLLGTTFAWFTDVVTSSGNKIQSGSLKLDLLVLNEVETTTGTRNEWVSIKDDQDPLFTYENWEPGYTDVTILKVENLGSLALKWEARFASEQPLSALAQVIDVYVLPGVEEYPEDRDDLDGWNKVGTLNQFVNTISETTYGYLDGKNTVGGTTSATLGIALKMREEAGNEYQNLTLGEFDIRIVATQATKEEDSFGSDYDKDAQWPVFSGTVSASAPVTTTDGKLDSETTATSEDGRISATLPKDVAITNGASSVTLSVSEVKQSEANLLTAPNEQILPVDVHIEGVAAGNTIPIAVTVEALLPRGLNAGNYNLYHVENGSSVRMTLRAQDATPVHNDFDYDPATGDVTLYLASFSEIALVANTDNVWTGDMDFSWYKYSADNKNYKIANADQLAALSAIVGGMKYDMKGNAIPHAQDSFKDKTVTLYADINIGDSDKYWDDPSGNGFMFYPIGYYNSTGSYEKVSGGSVSSGFERFEGTFDGNGHTISHFYQNTWEAFGDYNDGYAGTPNHNRDGFGLFGKIYGGTVKNLTVDNFSSDGEFGTTGVIAAYAEGATFDNIAITNSNPRVYNIGNGGIVGCVGWYATDAGLKTTFKNITVDNTNKITALWGSWDVACGGILGQYYPTSGQTSANQPKNGGVHFENCHVSAVIDVYNDVCANYQYYAYRYSGMLIGSVRENVEQNGHVYPKMDGITAENCTVHYGDWNDYYYCEIVANSLASYTHDHQMSRLTQVAEVDVANKKYLPLNGTKWVAIPTSGWAHYVVVKSKDASGKWIHGDGAGYATCYHFVNGVQHKHDVADSSNPNINETVDGKTVLKEDKQLIYREFNNLVTGYGWGVTSKGVDDVAGVQILEKVLADSNGESYDKFAENANAPTALWSNHKYTLGEFFKAVANPEVGILPGTVTVAANNVGNDRVYVKINRDANDWTQSTIEFLGTGTVTLTIQDYYFCNPFTTTKTFEISGQFLNHNDTYSPNDDFFSEWDEETETGSFMTSGETTYYTVSDSVAGDNSKYFYVETDLTVHEIVDEAQWAKIGFVTGWHYKNTGDKAYEYRMLAFYLNVNLSGYGDWDGDGKNEWGNNKNSNWNNFGVCETLSYIPETWGWSHNYDNVYSGDYYKMNSSMAPAGKYATPGYVTFGETIKLALLRDNLSYHIFVNDQYLFTYQIDETSELYEGRNAETNVGFFHFSSKATFDNCKVFKAASLDALTSQINGYNDSVVIPEKTAWKLPNFTNQNAVSSNIHYDDWCYHNFEKHEYQAPTADEVGYNPYNYCVKCKLYYAADAIEIGTKTKYTLKSEGFATNERFKISVWDGITVTKPEGSGTKDDPYLIANGANLAWLRDRVAEQGKDNTITDCCSGEFFKMTSNIDLGGHHLMIGYYGTSSTMDAFAGTFDGNGYRISNIRVETKDEADVGLFAIVHKGVIKNLTVQGSVAGTKDRTGGIVGRLYQSTMENCVSYVNVFSTTAAGVGGVVGLSQNSTVTNCVNYGAVVGKTVGGIAGSATGTITGCKNYGVLVGTNVGNIYGAKYNNGSVTGVTTNANTYTATAWDGTTVTEPEGSGTEKNPYLIASGANLAWIMNNMSAKQSFSGKFFKMTGNIDLGKHHLMIGSYVNTTDMKAFAGTFDGNGYCIVNLAINDETADTSGTGLFACVYGGTVKNLTVHGTVTSADIMAGGIVGRLEGAASTLQNCTSFVTVESTNAGTANAAGTGGLVGISNNGSIIDCANYGTVTGNKKVGGIAGSARGIITDCRNYGTVDGTADFGNIYGVIYTGTGLTVTDVWDGTSVSTSFSGGDGSVNNPYLISSGADLAYLDEYVSTGNLYNATSKTYNYKYFKLTGNIDLNGHSITIGDCSTGWVSTTLFHGEFDGQGYSILNLKIEDSTAANSEGLFPLIYSATIKNLTVTGSVSGSAKNIGGIVGNNHRGTLDNCTSYVNVTSNGGNYAGGLVGFYNYSSSYVADNQVGAIKNCVNYGSVSGAKYSGGIAGSASGIITNCTNNGDVAGTTKAGQIYAHTDTSLANANRPETIIVTGCTENNDMLQISFDNGTIVNTGTMQGATVGQFTINGENGTNKNGKAFVATNTMTFTTGLGGDANGAAVTNHSKGPYTAVKGITLGTGDFTVSAWFNIPVGQKVSTGNSTYIFGNYRSDWTSGTNGGFRTTIRYVDGHYVLACRSADQSQAAATLDMKQGEWHLLTITRKGTTVSFYFDDTLVVTQTVAENYDFGSYDIGFGGNVGETWAYQNSNIHFDNIRVYDNAIGLDKIQNLLVNDNAAK